MTNNNNLKPFSDKLIIDRLIYENPWWISGNIEDEYRVMKRRLYYSLFSPLVEEIANEYAGKIIVYKVDTDAEKLLSQSMGISSLPTLLFIPVKGQPQASMGAVPKESLVKAINEILLIK